MSLVPPNRRVVSIIAIVLALGIPYVYDRQDGWNHAMDLIGPVNARCRYIMDRFLEECLGR